MLRHTVVAAYCKSLVSGASVIATSCFIENASTAMYHGVFWGLCGFNQD